MKKKIAGGLIALAVMAACITILVVNKIDGVNYSNAENWAYAETEVGTKDADIFFVCPTVYGGTDNVMNMSMKDVPTKAAFLGATNRRNGRRISCSA